MTASIEGLLTKRFGRTVAAAFGLSLLIATTTVEVYGAVYSSSVCAIVQPANMPSCSTTCYQLNYSAVALWTLVNLTAVQSGPVSTPNRNTTGLVDFVQDVCAYGDGFERGNDDPAFVTSESVTTYSASVTMFSADMAPLNNLTFYFPVFETPTGTHGNMSLYLTNADHSASKDFLGSCNASQASFAFTCEPDQLAGASVFVEDYSGSTQNGTTYTTLQVTLIDYWMTRVTTVLNTTTVPTCSIPTAGVATISAVRYCSLLSNLDNGAFTAPSVLPFLVAAAAIKGIDALLQAFANEGSSLVPLSANTAVGWRIGLANKIMHLAAFIFVAIAYGSVLAEVGANIQTGPIAVIGLNIASEAAALIWVFGLRGLFYRHAPAIQAWLHRRYPRLVGAPESGLADKVVVSS